MVGFDDDALALACTFYIGARAERTEPSFREIGTMALPPLGTFSEIGSGVRRLLFVW